MDSIARQGRKAALWTAGGAAAFVYTNYPTEVETGLLGTAALGTVGAGYAATNWVLEVPHRWKWVTPLHRALCNSLGVPAETRPRKYIKIRRNYHKREEIGRIMLPAEFTGTDTTTPTHVIKAKLGLTDATVTYRLAGRRPYLSIRQTPRPPARVLFADHRDQVATAKESAPLIGIGPQGRQVSVDLDAESPHILVNASTGGGKSVTTQTIICQMLHTGSQAVILDFKRHSHKWAVRLSQVAYCKGIGEIHDVLVALGAEGYRRNMIVDEWEGDDRDAPVGPRMVVLVEEANATIKKLKKYWSEIRTPLDPKESPALTALGEVLFMGRAVRMHVLLVAQSATAAALGGPEVRECFATRIMARYTVNAWRMLVPEVHPVPRSTRHTGRAQVVLGGVATETQVMYFTPQEAAEWAGSGTVAPPPDLMSRDTTPTLSQVEVLPDLSRDVTPALTLVKDEERMSLAEAARRGVVPMKYDALRQAKRRPGFPVREDGRYTAAELQRWYSGRSA